MTPPPSDDAAVRWRDSDPLDPRWSPPSLTTPEASPPDHPGDESDDSQGRRRRAFPWVPGVLGALAIVIGLVAGFGGFAEREDLATRVPAKTTINTGPYEFTFTSATVQLVDDLGKPGWEVRVLGTGRTTGEVSLAPLVGLRNSMFRGLDHRGDVVDPEIARVGTERSISDGATFTPGLPAVDYVVEFEMPPTYAPTETFVFAVWSLEFRDTSLLRNQDPTWANAKQFWRYELPMKRLPDEKIG